LEDGLRYGIGKINCLELRGTYREMGRQYGRLFKDMMARFYAAAIEGYFLKESRMPYLRLLGLAGLIFHRYPQHIKEMMKGMSEASGLGLSRIIMLDQVNAFEYIRNQGVGRCSNIAVWGDYTGWDGLIFGRNYDQPEQFTAFNEFITVTALNPDDGIPTASIGYAGQVGATSAINACGVFVSDNEAPTMKGDRININMPNVLVLELDFLTRSRSLAELDAMLRSARANCPVIVTAGDAAGACVYEWSVAGLKRRAEAIDGIAVATNHFADPSWDAPPLTADAYAMTLGRRANLLSLGHRFRCRFDVPRMKEVLALTVEEGGATYTGRTTFQIIMVPHRLELHINVPGFQGWTEMGLEKALKRYASAGDAEFSLQNV
jgi:hypothetical protein